MVDDHFAQQLKARRKNSSLTQQQLADKLNVSRKTISGWETGRNRPDIDILRQMAKIYHISLDQLVSDADKVDQSQNSGIIRFTRNSLVVMLAIIIAERVTQYSTRAGFLLADILIFWILGLRILASRKGIRGIHSLKSDLFLGAYIIFVIVAIVSAYVYVFNMGFGLQYGIGFSGYLGLLNLFLIFRHKFELK